MHGAHGGRGRRAGLDQVIACREGSARSPFSSGAPALMSGEDGVVDVHHLLLPAAAGGPEARAARSDLEGQQPEGRLGLGEGSTAARQDECPAVIARLRNARFRFCMSLAPSLAVGGGMLPQGSLFVAVPVRTIVPP